MRKIYDPKHSFDIPLPDGEDIFTMSDSSRKILQTLFNKYGFKDNYSISNFNLIIDKLKLITTQSSSFDIKYTTSSASNAINLYVTSYTSSLTLSLFYVEVIDLLDDNKVVYTDSISSSYKIINAVGLNPNRSYVIKITGISIDGYKTSTFSTPSISTKGADYNVVYYSRFYSAPTPFVPKTNAVDLIGLIPDTNLPLEEIRGQGYFKFEYTWKYRKKGDSTWITPLSPSISPILDDKIYSSKDGYMLLPIKPSVSSTSEQSLLNYPNSVDIQITCTPVYVPTTSSISKSPETIKAISASASLVSVVDFVDVFFAYKSKPYPDIQLLSNSKTSSTVSFSTSLLNTSSVSKVDSTTTGNPVTKNSIKVVDGDGRTFYLKQLVVSLFKTGENGLNQPPSLVSTTNLNAYDVFNSSSKQLDIILSASITSRTKYNIVVGGLWYADDTFSITDTYCSFNFDTLTNSETPSTPVLKTPTKEYNTSTITSHTDKVDPHSAVSTIYLQAIPISGLGITLAEFNNKSQEDKDSYYSNAFKNYTNITTFAGEKLELKYSITDDKTTTVHENYNIDRVFKLSNLVPSEPYLVKSFVVDDGSATSIGAYYNFTTDPAFVYPTGFSATVEKRTFSSIITINKATNSNVPASVSKVNYYIFLKPKTTPSSGVATIGSVALPDELRTVFYHGVATDTSPMTVFDSDTTNDTITYNIPNLKDGSDYDVGIIAVFNTDYPNHIDILNAYAIARAGYLNVSFKTVTLTNVEAPAVTLKKVISYRKNGQMYSRFDIDTVIDTQAFDAGLSTSGMHEDPLVYKIRWKKQGSTNWTTPINLNNDATAYTSSNKPQTITHISEPLLAKGTDDGSVPNTFGLNTTYDVQVWGDDGRAGTPNYLDIVLDTSKIENEPFVSEPAYTINRTNSTIDLSIKLTQGSLSNISKLYVTVYDYISGQLLFTSPTGAMYDSTSLKYPLGNYKLNHLDLTNHSMEFSYIINTVVSYKDGSPTVSNSSLVNISFNRNLSKFLYDDTCYDNRPYWLGSNSILFNGKEDYNWARDTYTYMSRGNPNTYTPRVGANSYSEYKSPHLFNYFLSYVDSNGNDISCLTDRDYVRKICTDNSISTVGLDVQTADTVATNATVSELAGSAVPYNAHNGSAQTNRNPYEQLSNSLNDYNHKRYSKSSDAPATLKEFLENWHNASEKATSNELHWKLFDCYDFSISTENILTPPAQYSGIFIKDDLQGSLLYTYFNSQFDSSNRRFNYYCYKILSSFCSYLSISTISQTSIIFSRYTDESRCYSGCYNLINRGLSYYGYYASTYNPSPTFNMGFHNPVMQLVHKTTGRPYSPVYRLNTNYMNPNKPTHTRIAEFTR